MRKSKAAQRSSSFTALTPERVLFPSAGFTVEDAVDYYRDVSKFILPHLRGRPLSFKRYPENVLGESFWEKDVPPYAPDWVTTFPVPRKSGGPDIRYVVVDSRDALLWVVSIGGIELHPFLHRVPQIDRPTHIVFDLDPGPRATILHCCRVATIVREYLDALRLESLVKVSGSKGLQLYVPLNTAVTHDAAEAFARIVAEELAWTHPAQIVAKMAKTLRPGKVFIDWSQNAWFKTTVCVYSLRAKRPMPFVSMPVEWKEVETALKKGSGGDLEFSPDDAIARVTKRGDLFAPLLTKMQRLPREFVETFRSIAPKKRARGDEETLGKVVKGIRLPRPRTQSGRRLFVLVDGAAGSELWLDVAGKFKRWVLRPDREGGDLIALPAGSFPVHDSYFRGEVQPEYRPTVKIEDIGAWERIEGTFDEERVIIFFEGRTLTGEWKLEKIEHSSKHRSWSLMRLA